MCFVSNDNLTINNLILYYFLEIFYIKIEFIFSTVRESTTTKICINTIIYYLTNNQVLFEKKF